MGYLQRIIWLSQHVGQEHHVIVDIAAHSFFMQLFMQKVFPAPFTKRQIVHDVVLLMVVYLRRHVQRLPLAGFRTRIAGLGAQFIGCDRITSLRRLIFPGLPGKVHKVLGVERRLGITAVVNIKQAGDGSGFPRPITEE